MRANRGSRETPAALSAALDTIAHENSLALLKASCDVVYRVNAQWTVLHHLYSRGVMEDIDLPCENWLEKYIPAEARESLQTAIAHALEKGTAFEIEHSFARRDGSVGWVVSRAIPIFDGSNRIVEWLGAAMDVTARRLNEEALTQLVRQSEHERRLYQTILSTIPDFVYVFDLDHRFIYVNQSLLEMWGKTADEALGRNCLELGYEPWHAAMHDREIDTVIETKRPIRGEVPFHGTHGRRIYDYIFAPVFGSDGEVVAIAGTTRDVTDRKQAEDALREADRRKDEFLAVLAHELRNPLAPISNAIQLLRRVRNVDPMQNQAHLIIERQSARLAHLVDDLLEVSRITSGRIQLRRENVSLISIVERAVEGARPIIEQRTHTLELVVSMNSILVAADATRLEQVVVNLLNNAAKYTQNGGSIRVSVSVDGEQAVIGIRDTGVGIEPQLLPHVFELFTQAERSIDRAQGGLGVGLFLVKKLVEMHGGTVEAHSEIGQGSEFIVRLPVVPVTALEIESHVREKNPSSTAALKILVVDDNIDAADSLTQLLKNAGHSVATAYDGESALDLALKDVPDVALLDIGLPKLDGYALAKRLREDATARQITLVAMTGYGQGADRRRSEEAGFDVHLVKPVDFERVERILYERSNGQESGQFRG